MPTPTFKIVFVGNSSVGKSSIVHRYCGIDWNPEHVTTIGAALFIKQISILCDGKRKNLQLHLWETGGQERFFCLVPMYLRNADAVIFVFDTSDNGKSLEMIRSLWMKKVKEYISPPFVYFLVGNKIDLLTREEKDQLSDSIPGLPKPRYVSAKTGIGIRHLFDSLAQKIMTDDFLAMKNKKEKENEETQLKFDNSCDPNEKNGCCLGKVFS